MHTGFEPVQDQPIYGIKPYLRELPKRIPIPPLHHLKQKKSPKLKKEIYPFYFLFCHSMDSGLILCSPSELLPKSTQYTLPTQEQLYERFIVMY
jgi:hypothetical protein